MTVRRSLCRQVIIRASLDGPIFQHQYLTIATPKTRSISLLQRQTISITMGDIRETLNDAPISSVSIPVATSWQTAGPAAFDFRSDTITTPTLPMLQAIAQSSLGDDVYHEDTTTASFEAFIADLTGKEAALLVMSGTMGNQIALRSLLTQPPHSILCHHQAHIFIAEAGGCAVLSQAQIQPCIPANGLYLTLEDIQRDVILGTNIHCASTRVISLENTLAGTITPLSELQRISAFARDNKIKMHLDGARIWEAVAAGAGTLKEFLACFDTAQMCFSKGLAAPIGSIIVGEKKTLEHCEWTRKMIGGGIRQAGIIAAAARVAVEENFGKLKANHVKAKRIEEMWVSRGGRVMRPVETNMVILDLEHSGRTLEEMITIGKQEGLKFMYSRIVVHLQICEEAIMRLGRIMGRLLEKKGAVQP